jgi:hypothetical protein
MQIYEITKKPRVNEVLGTMAAGVGKALANKFISSQLPGVSLYGDDDDTAAKPGARQTLPLPPPYKPPTPNVGQQQAGYTSANTNASTGAAVPATQSWQGTNINVPAVQRKQAAQAAAQQTTAPTWQGNNINVPAVQRKQTAQAAAPAATAPSTAPAVPVATTTAPSVTPRPGYRIMVQVPAGGKYYKTDKGWANEVGQAITRPASVAALEKRADSAGREERITKPQPARLPGKSARTRRTR